MTNLNCSQLLYDKPKFGIKFITGLSLFLLLFYSPCKIAFGQDGEAIFKQTCSACHTIGKGKLVGPDLAHVHTRRDVEWLHKFIKSSQSLIKSGDKTADSLYQAFNKAIMPDQPLDDNSIKSILAYIESSSSAPAAVSQNAAPSTAPTVQNEADEIFLTNTNIILMIAVIALLAIILTLAKMNRKLAEELADLYNMNRTFFKK